MKYPGQSSKCEDRRNFNHIGSHEKKNSTYRKPTKPPPKAAKLPWNPMKPHETPALISSTCGASAPITCEANPRALRAGSASKRGLGRHRRSGSMVMNGIYMGCNHQTYMGLSSSENGGTPRAKWFSKNGKSDNKMDENWGYPYLGNLYMGWFVVDIVDEYG